MPIDFCNRKQVLPFENRKWIVFYQIREEVKIIKIVTKYRIEKPRKFKKKIILKFLILPEILRGRSGNKNPTVKTCFRTSNVSQPSLVVET